MAIFVLLSLLLSIIFLPFSADAISSCNRPCRYPIDCGSKLNCINGKCKDDPNFGTHICSGGSYICKPIRNVTCPDGVPYPTYDCSAPVTSSTPAKLRNRDFSEGGYGWKSECDGKYHAKTERVVSLSTGWYNGGSRCGKMVRVWAGNGRSVTAKVVDECDSLDGCHEMHGGKPPCGNDIVDGSDGVWNGLGLNKGLGVVDVTWSTA